MGNCMSSGDELAAQILGAEAAGRDPKAVRRLSALGLTDANEVWITRQTSDIHKVFKFGAEINKGQFGTLYVVTDPNTGTQFACKQISKRKLTGANSIRDIRREIEIMHHLRGHPNVITFHGAYEDLTDVYLVMELCTGGDLFERIQGATTVTERSAASLFRELVETVAYCHTLGVVHRDIKPENFLITDPGPDARIKLSDFGLSAFFREGEPMTGVVGSAYYMAPEVLSGEYGKPCDVWSLGVVLHIILCGSPPFTGASDADILQAMQSQELDLTNNPWPNISRHARHLVSKMLEKDPERRLRLDQVLTHPWLRLDGTAPARAIPGGVRSRMQAFRQFNAFKREARLILAKALPPEEVMGLKLLFEELDRDKDGLLSLAELREGLERKGDVLQGEDAAELLASADINGDGFIDYREFVAATYTLSKMEKEDALLRAFRHFDQDGDGFITRDELQAALAKQLPRDRSTSADALLAEADLDGDGRIDYREFCAMLLAAPPGADGGVAEPPELLIQFVRQPASLPGMVGEGGEGRGLLAFKSGKRRSTGSVASISSGTGGKPPHSNKTSPLPHSNKASPLPASDRTSPLPRSNKASPLPGSNKASPGPRPQLHSPSSPHDLAVAQEGSDVLDSDDEGVFRGAANGAQRNSAGLAARPAAGGGGGSRRGLAAGMGSGSVSGADRKVSGGRLEIGEGSGRSAW